MERAYEKYKVAIKKTYKEDNKNLLQPPNIPMIKVSKLSFPSREKIILLCSRSSEKTISNIGVRFSPLHVASTAKHVGL